MPGVIEQRDRLGLVLEAPQLGVVGQHAGLDHLEGDGPVEADLPRLVDDAHAAAAELFLNLVVAEVADGGAARQVGRGLVAVGRAGRKIGVGCPVGGGVMRKRGRFRDSPSDVRPGRLGVARRRLGRLARARRGESCRGVDIGWAGQITGCRPAHQAAGAEALRGVCGSFGAATRASVRRRRTWGDSVGHGVVPVRSGYGCRSPGGEQRRVRQIVARTFRPWIAAGPSSSLTWCVFLRRKRLVELANRFASLLRSSLQSANQQSRCALRSDDTEAVSAKHPPCPLLAVHIHPDRNPQMGRCIERASVP